MAGAAGPLRCGVRWAGRRLRVLRQPQATRHGNVQPCGPGLAVTLTWPCSSPFLPEPPTPPQQPKDTRSDPSLMHSMHFGHFLVKAVLQQCKRLNLISHSSLSKVCADEGESPQSPTPASHPSRTGEGGVRRAAPRSLRGPRPCPAVWSRLPWAGQQVPGSRGSQTCHLCSRSSYAELSACILEAGRGPRLTIPPFSERPPMPFAGPLTRE